MAPVTVTGACDNGFLPPSGKKIKDKGSSSTTDQKQKKKKVFKSVEILQKYNLCLRVLGNYISAGSSSREIISYICV